MTEEVIPLIPLPQSRRAKASVWRDIGVAETDHLLVLSKTDDIKSYIQSVFKIQDDPNGRHIILMDLFFYATQFCKKNSFNSEKTSCLLSIIKQTHDMASETPFGNLKETLEFFKDLVICHSVHRPPFSLGIFSPQEASAISYYVIDTYFRHFKLYKYAFTPEVQLDLTISYEKIPKTAAELDEERRSANEEMAAQSNRSDNAVSENQEDEENPEEIETTQQQAESDSETDDSKSEALRELRRVIRERLSTELQELKVDFASQLKQSDDTLSKLVSGSPESAKKSGRQSAKKKK